MATYSLANLNIKYDAIIARLGDLEELLQTMQPKTNAQEVGLLTAGLVQNLRGDVTTLQEEVTALQDAAS